MIAFSVIHDKAINKEITDHYFEMIFEYSQYEHDYVKKAVVWALREIGKSSTTSCMILKKAEIKHEELETLRNNFLAIL